MGARRRSPLHDRHAALGARLAWFAGWEMPLDYGSIVAEHHAVREDCGVFDLSHLGTLRVTGPDALGTVQRAFTNDASTLQVGRAHYSLCLNADGGIIDDLLVYRLPWGFFVVPNAANAARVRAVLTHSGASDVVDVKDGLACLAVQGPRSAAVMAAAGLPVDGLRYLDCRPLDASEDEMPPDAGVLARSGYTGEQGYELFVPAVRARGMWDRIIEAGATPAGLGARDTLRLEMGYCLHGSDISPETSPVEARLEWAVKPHTPFQGRDSYLQAKAQGLRRRLWGLRVSGRGIPRPHCAVWCGGEAVGETTSGTFSPTLRAGIALGYLHTTINPGDLVDIEVRGRLLPAQVVKPPFVASHP
jgi:glycine cleavage system T protein (aminomethyltransferase)